MSCGKPHETPCSDVLDQLYIYLDGELDGDGCEKIRQHLDECRDCLDEYGLEESIKKLVGERCGCDAAPPGLRDKIMVRIQEVRVEIGPAE
jgi:mycothiol system anti-sigma-R factor